MDFKISCMNKYIHTELSRLFYSPLWSTESLGWPLQHCFPGGQQRHCLIKAGERSFTGDHAAASSEYGLSPCGFCRLVDLPRKITSSHSCGLVAFRVFFILTLCFEHDLLQLQNQQSCEVGPQARGESSKLLPSVKQNKTKKNSLIKILLTIITQNALLPVVYAILLLDHQQGDVIIKRV